MRAAEQIKKLLLDRLNSILSRPEMWVICEADLELQLRILIHDLSYIDEIEIGDDTIREELAAEGLYFPFHVAAGVSQVLKNIMPDVSGFKDEICSVYARKAHQIGYLDIKNILSSLQFNQLIQRIIIGEFSQGFNPEKLLEEIPPSSFNTGHTLCYASENSERGWIYFDFSGSYIEGKGHQYLLRNIRWPAGTFEDGFELTKEGYEQTRRGIAHPQFDDEAFMEAWKEGVKWAPGESLPNLPQKPKTSRWQHLW